MATYAYERLSAQDSTFLVFEDPAHHMHVGGTGILEAGRLATRSGGVDIERIRAYIASRLHLIPRYRQRLSFVPITNYPVWVDDDHFNLNYHVRHTSLPHPGDEHQLKQLVGRIMSQQLDRGKPLWEAWFVEGLEGGRFAFINKAHHCMVDGIASVDLISVLMTFTPDDRIETPPPWTPRPAPSPAELLRDEFGRRMKMPVELARRLRRALQDPDHLRADLAERASAAWQMAGAGLRIPAPTPLNQPVGPHRRFDWLTLDLAEVKEVKNRLGGTVNDVVLATVAGAVGCFLQRRGADVDELDYRVALPVSTRTPEEHGTPGNRVSAWLASLPIHEPDPRRRLATVRETTAKLKESKQALGAETLTQVGEWAGSALLTLGVRLAARLHPFHLIVTNVPGPQMPLYLLGARMIEGYPEVPLFENQGIGVALLSYVGKLCWGFNADLDLVPDLHDFVEAVSASFDDLRAAAAGREGRPRSPQRAGPARARTQPRASPHRARRARRDIESSAHGDE